MAFSGLDGREENWPIEYRMSLLLAPFRRCWSWITYAVCLAVSTLDILRRFRTLKISGGGIAGAMKGVKHIVRTAIHTAMKTHAALAVDDTV